MHGGQQVPFDHEPYRQILLATWPKSAGSEQHSDCISCLTSHQIAFADVKVQHLCTSNISMFQVVTPLTKCCSRNLCPFAAFSAEHHGMSVIDLMKHCLHQLFATCLCASSPIVPLTLTAN